MRASSNSMLADYGPSPQVKAGYGADARKVAAEATRAFVDDDPLFLQSTGSVLHPEGRVLVSGYSSGAIGRLVPDDVIAFVRYIQQR